MKQFLYNLQSLKFTIKIQLKRTLQGLQVTCATHKLWRYFASYSTVWISGSRQLYHLQHEVYSKKYKCILSTNPAWEFFLLQSRIWSHSIVKSCSRTALVCMLLLGCVPGVTYGARRSSSRFRDGKKRKKNLQQQTTATEPLWGIKTTSAGEMHRKSGGCGGGDTQKTICVHIF